MRAAQRQREAAQLQISNGGGLHLDSSAQEGSFGAYLNTAAATKIALPAGTERKIEKGRFEEVTIPAPDNGALGEPELVPVEVLPDWAQLAFKGTSHLNRVQSIVFDTAYHSNENMLICAPTGAGKTNCAMLTVLHEVGCNLHAGVLNLKEFKIVYVAPMKALAAEMAATFQRRLGGLGMVVKEYTGDMQLTKKEVENTQILVTTPEKWDVVTRKTSDAALTSMVKLLIIDEVHLLHDERGTVIESLVARTLRTVESSQSMIRIVGLSATLPNYQDVAAFLRVNLSTGLFFFDSRYRPVPLVQKFVGIIEKNSVRQQKAFDEVCFDHCIKSIRQGNQVMVFVHARNATTKTARALVQLAEEKGKTNLFSNIEHPQYDASLARVEKSRNQIVRELFQSGFGCHHAGMLRSDRNLMESLFSQGLVRVLVCTATLAWGVNLPAHTIVIKGTKIYKPEKGGFDELSMLDVMQMFGRAGRPQFDTSGEGIILTTHDKLNYYLAMTNHQMPIESQFLSRLPDNLNAEIVLGTVSNVEEATQWLRYTYFYQRVMKNPLAYGVAYDAAMSDPNLESHRRDLIRNAAQTLHKCNMIRYVPSAGVLAVTDLGRVASHYYLSHLTVDMYNQEIDKTRENAMDEAHALRLVSMSNEFAQVKVRDEEMKEMDKLVAEACVLDVMGGVENVHGKVNALIQAHISRAPIESFALVSDSNFVNQSSGRLLRALFEISLKRGKSQLAQMFLNLCKSVEWQLWEWQNPLRQLQTLKPELLHKLENPHKGRPLTIERMRDMPAREIGHMMHHPKAGDVIKQAVNRFPSVSLEVTMQPVTRTVLKVEVAVTPEFQWHDRIHGSVQIWWIWVEDAYNEHLYHSEQIMLFKKTMHDVHKLNFTMPILDPMPEQFFVHALHDRLIGAETQVAVSYKGLILPEMHPAHTKLLDLTPLPKAVLKNPKFESMYKFETFNPVQTQVFHTAFHSDDNMLLGAPTGSGKTVVAELAMLRVFSQYPDCKVVYVAPLKALVRERMRDWKIRIVQKLGLKVLELSGEVTPSVQALNAAQVLVVTPEKWDGISRQWRDRNYVKKVALVVIDEIHLLGADRGPILEVIVSRMRYIGSQTGSNVRMVGLSTALSNAHDLGDWLGIENQGLFNFKPSVRPVPLEAHIKGFSGKHYCPRMKTMNKPVYQDILTYSPEKPVLVFVSSRRQTRLTALDLLGFCTQDDNPTGWCNLDEDALRHVQSKVKDVNLRHFLEFGIGIHHAGLKAEDKDVVEELFVNNKIQVVICTSTLAWGVNFPAHLVIIKGTEFYDAPTHRYVDFPITDVLQMMGRAGRPQFDKSGVASILVHDVKKDFYKKFLYEPFPVESSLHNVLHDHFNAEIVGGTIKSKQDAMDYLTWTFLFRRLLMNPSYYALDSTDDDTVNEYLSNLVESTVTDLELAGCVTVDEEDNITPESLGAVASYYYLHYRTVRMFNDQITEEMSVADVLLVLTNAAEFEELPVRHNEDKLNMELAEQMPLETDLRSLDSPHTKAFLLLQGFFCHVTHAISDYYTDTKSVLEQTTRLLQAMTDIAAEAGLLETTLAIMNVAQMIAQSHWHDASTLLTLPHVQPQHVEAMSRAGVDCLPQLFAMPTKKIEQLLSRAGIAPKKQRQVVDVVHRLPQVEVSYAIESNTTPVGEDGEMSVTLTRLNKGSIKVHAPRFPKEIEEGWWLVLGLEDDEGTELLALKRVRFSSKTTTKLTFAALDDPAEVTLTLYLISDSYLGLDQEYSMQHSFV